MMGTSVLAMPWAIQQAGFALGIIIIITMMAITLYTCQLVLKHGEGGFINGQPVEFGDVIKIYLGPRSYVVSQCFSILTLGGACMVYWVLMTSFLRNIANFLVCTSPDLCQQVKLEGGRTTYKYSTPYWNDTMIPLYLILLLFPMLNLKSITFFTKLNSLGVISIIYLLAFIFFSTFYKAEGSPFGGLHMSDAEENHIEMADTQAFSLVGVLTLSYFIHNGALSIMRNAKRPQNNARDLSIAYGLVCATYLVVGVCLYVSFDGPKTKISQNFLDNFELSNVPAFVAQCFLLLQFFTVFPLLAFIIRFQTLTMVCNGDAWPSLYHVLGLNVFLIAACVGVAIFYPHIGSILRYCGAICGLIYVFTMPMLVDREILRRKGIYTWFDAGRVFALIAFGVANVLAQFPILSLFS